MTDNNKIHCPASIMALCQEHTNGEGCACRHFPQAVEKCKEYQRLLAISKQGGDNIV